MHVTSKSCRAAVPSFSALGRVLSSRASELSARTAGLKRLAFVVYSGRLDQFSRYLPYIVEKLVDALKLASTEPDRLASALNRRGEQLRVMVHCVVSNSLLPDELVFRFCSLCESCSVVCLQNI